MMLHKKFGNLLTVFTKLECSRNIVNSEIGSFEMIV